MRGLRLAASATILFTGTLLAQTPAKPAGAQAHPSATTATASDPVVITVGTQQIRASQFDALIKAAPPENQSAMLADKRAVADELGKLVALAEEAHRLGLDQDSGFRAQMLVDRDNALAKSVVDRLQSQSTPSDAQAKTYYDAHSADFAQTKLRHILVGDNETEGGPNPRSQAEALAKVNKIADQLKQGADFAAVAKSDSDDPGSKDKGGELEITPGQTVPEFETAVNALPVGKISDPIHTRYGYHIVQVESRATMPFDQAKPLIVEQLTGDSVTNAINRIAANAHIVISDSYFGPAKPPAPTTPHR